MRATTALASIALILAAGCGSPTPMPEPPTATPIPGYVAGEEDLAYESFAQYYKENCWRNMVFDDGGVISSRIDTSYIGRALYVGDGMWRFRFQIRKTYINRVNGEVKEELMEPEDAVQMVRSLPDGSWAGACISAGIRYESDYQRDRDYSSSDDAP